MPIDIQCTACGQRLRVGDGLAGKQAHCPKCKAKVNIPAVAGASSMAKATAAPAGTANATATAAKAQSSGARVATATPVVAAAAAPVKATRVAAAMPAAPVQAAPIVPPDEWHLQTPDGQSYGPISKTELEAWLAEDRITADSQLLPPGGQAWVAAALIYPSLAQMVQQPVMQQPAMQPQTPQFSSVAVPAMAPAQVAPTAAMPSFSPAAPSLATNPYASPTTPASPTFDAGDDIGSLVGIRRVMAETRPWTMFISIVGFISGGIDVLVGLFYLFLSVMALRSGVGPLIAFLGIFGLIMLGIGAVVIYMFVCLCSYSLRIGEFQRSASIRTLEGSLRAQRSFWRIAGIVLALSVAATVLMVVLSIAFGMSFPLEGPPQRF